MPIEIIGDFPCKYCGGTEIRTQEETIFYWVEVNHLLREDIINYTCWDCEKILIRVTHHTEEKY